MTAYPSGLTVSRHSRALANTLRWPSGAPSACLADPANAFHNGIKVFLQTIERHLRLNTGFVWLRSDLAEPVEDAQRALWERRSPRWQDVGAPDAKQRERLSASTDSSRPERSPLPSRATRSSVLRSCSTMSSRQGADRAVHRRMPRLRAAFVSACHRHGAFEAASRRLPDSGHFALRCPLRLAETGFPAQLLDRQAGVGRPQEATDLPFVVSLLRRSDIRLGSM